MTPHRIGKEPLDICTCTATIVVRPETNGGTTTTIVAELSLAMKTSNPASTRIIKVSVVRVIGTSSGEKRRRASSALAIRSTGTGAD
jgi:hypothetical protein